MENLDRVVRPKELTRILGLSRSTVYRLLQDRDSGFPPPLKITAAKSIGWRMSDIMAYLDKRERVSIEPKTLQKAKRKI